MVTTRGQAKKTRTLQPQPPRGRRAKATSTHHTDTTRIAKAAPDHRSRHRQIFEMETIKTMLHSFLDDVSKPKPVVCSDLAKLLSRWLDVWREDRSHALLIYVLDDGSGQDNGRKMDIYNLNAIDQIKTNILIQECSKQNVCLQLGKMTSAVNISPETVLDVKATIQLLQTHDLHTGQQLNDKPITIQNDNIIQKGLLRYRYYDQGARPTPRGGSTVSQTDTLKNFQDRVSIQSLLSILF